MKPSPISVFRVAGASVWLMALASFACADLPDVKTVSAPILKLRMDAFMKQRQHEKVDWDAVNGEMRKLALTALEKVDVKQVSDEQAADWSDLYEIAGKHDIATNLAAKSINYFGYKGWMAQCGLLNSYLSQGDKAKILLTLDSLIAPDVRMTGQVGEFVKMELSSKFKATDPKFVLKCFDLLLRRVDLNLPRDPNDQDWALFAYASLSAARDQVLLESGRKQEALSDLSKVRKRVASNARALNAVDELYKQMTLTSQVAPEIVADRTLGQYSGLRALRGKVVLLDFFAHWCGPCKAAFPAMKSLYSDLHSKGVDVVGVTSMYGYFGAKQGLKPAEEFELMKNSFIPEFGLPWPVVFEKDRSASKAYGVSGIPHLVVIDRSGKIRKIEVGYLKDEFVLTWQLVEKLVAEPAPK